MRISNCTVRSCAQSPERLQKLKARHDEVVRHEDAHYREAGDLALSKPVLSDFVEGEDGKQYATGGHVMIDTSETGDPIRDAQRGRIIVRAAEAPLSVDSELSQADKNIAAKGRQIIEKSESKLDKLNKLKSTLGHMASRLSTQQVEGLARGLDLDMKPGKILNFLA